MKSVLHHHGFVHWTWRTCRLRLSPSSRWPGAGSVDVKKADGAAFRQPCSISGVDIGALCEDEVAPLAERIASRFLQQNSKGHERRLVHAALVDALLSALRGGVLAATLRVGKCRIEMGGIAMDGLEHVAVGQNIPPAVRQSLVRVVDVLLGISDGGPGPLEQDFLWGQRRIAQVGAVATLKERLRVRPVAQGTGRRDAACAQWSVIPDLEAGATAKKKDGLTGYRIVEVGISLSLLSPLCLGELGGGRVRVRVCRRRRHQVVSRPQI